MFFAILCLSYIATAFYQQTLYYQLAYPITSHNNNNKTVVDLRLEMYTHRNLPPLPNPSSPRYPQTPTYAPVYIPQYQPPYDPLADLTAPMRPAQLPSTSTQYLHYNNLIAQNSELHDDNKVLLHKLQKYQKLQPYINTLIARNSDLQQQNDKLGTQNVYLGKNIKQLHLQNSSVNEVHLRRIQELEDAIMKGKENGQKVRSENDGLLQKIKMHIAEIEQYKSKLEQAITEKIQVEMLIKQVKSERDRLLGQIKQLQLYNKQLAKTLKSKQQQHDHRQQQSHKTQKQLQSVIQEQQHKINTMQEHLNNQNLQRKQIEKQYAVLQNDHGKMLDQFRKLSLGKVELQDQYEQCMGRVLRREEQLKEVQMFRENQRDQLNQEFAKLKLAFEQQRHEYQQALSHKSLKIQKLTLGYNQLMQRIDQIHNQMWQCQQKLTLQQSTITQQNQQLQKCHTHTQLLLHELDQRKNKQQELVEQVHSALQQKQMLLQATIKFESKYAQRQNQFQQYIKNMADKFERDRNKWEGLYQEQKNKIKIMHEYDRREIEGMLNKKILLLETEIEDYRNRLSRNQCQLMDRTVKDNANVKVLRNIVEVGSWRPGERDRSLDRDNSKDKDKDKDKRDKMRLLHLSQFNPSSATKTAKYL